MALKRHLAETFFSHLEEPIRPDRALFDDDAVAAVADDISRAFDFARDRFQGLALDAGEYAQYLAERATADGELALPAHSEDLYLACACARADADARAIELFDREILDQSRSVLRRLGCAAAEAEDVMQEVRTKLLVAPRGGEAKITQYQGTGPLVSWVRAVAGRQALAARRRHKPDETLDPELLDLTDDPHLRALKERYRQQFRDAFRAAVAALSEGDRALLADVVIRETPVGEIAADRGVHRVTASRWLAKIRQTLLSDTRDRLAAELDLESADIDSVIRLIESRLEVSLYSVLSD